MNKNILVVLRKDHRVILDALDGYIGNKDTLAKENENEWVAWNIENRTKCLNFVNEMVTALHLTDRELHILEHALHRELQMGINSPTLVLKLIDRITTLPFS